MSLMREGCGCAYLLRVTQSKEVTSAGITFLGEAAVGAEAPVNWGEGGGCIGAEPLWRNGSFVWLSCYCTRPPLWDPWIEGRWEDEMSERGNEEKERSARRRK